MSEKLLRSAVLVSLGFFCLLTFLPLEIEAQTSSKQKKNYDDIVKQIGRKHQIDPSLIHSIIRAESAYNPKAISPKGAVGLMQLMPETAKLYKVKNLLDPRQNIEGGVKYLKDLIKLYDSKTNLVLAAYNAGQEAIKKYGGIPPYRETRNYVANVRTTFNKPKIQRWGMKVHRFYDKEGKWILTNDPQLIALYKAKTKTIEGDPSFSLR